MRSNLLVDAGILFFPPPPPPPPAPPRPPPPLSPRPGRPACHRAIPVPARLHGRRLLLRRRDSTGARQRLHRAVSLELPHRPPRPTPALPRLLHPPPLYHF